MPIDFKNEQRKRTLPRFRKWLGKKVKVTTEDGTVMVGELVFAGVNNKVHGKFQVTLNKTPLWPIDPNKIKLYEKEI